jgi:hypothetical protein
MKITVEEVIETEIIHIHAQCICRREVMVSEKETQRGNVKESKPSSTNKAKKDNVENYVGRDLNASIFISS